MNLLRVVCVWCECECVECVLVLVVCVCVCQHARVGHDVSREEAAVDVRLHLLPEQVIALRVSAAKEEPNRAHTHRWVL